MADVIARHELSLYPDYGLVTLRDRESEPAVDADQAVASAYREVAAATPTELYVIRAVEDLPILVQVEIWDGDPGLPVDGWQATPEVVLTCPSGDLRLGDNTGEAIGDILLPRGPGRYRVQLFHTGRDTARERMAELGPAADALPWPERRHFLESRAAGTERYLIRIW